MSRTNGQLEARIIMASDVRGMTPTAATVNSLVRNCNIPVHVRIFVRDHSYRSFTVDGLKVEFIYVPQEYQRIGSVPGHVDAGATFDRIAGARMSSDWDSALILDYDQIVIKPIDELFEFNFGDSLAAGRLFAEKLGPSISKWFGRSLPQEWAHITDYDFLFMGPLLNLKLMRAHNSFDVFDEFQKECGMEEQIALLAALGNRVCELPMTYNIVPQWDGITSDARILHFTGPEKPWSSPTILGANYWSRFATDWAQLSQGQVRSDCRPNRSNGEKPASIHVGVCSARTHADRRKAIVETWGNEIPDGITLRFFVGVGEGKIDEDMTMILPVEDCHEEVPSKVMAYFSWALDNLNFDWLFKCDDDTFVCLNRLSELITEGYDLVGNSFLEVRGSPCGGAGYLVSRDLVRRLVTEGRVLTTGAEDILIGEEALRLGGKALASEHLVSNRSRRPSLDNNVISSHWCSPSDMHAIQGSFGERPEEIELSHPEWTDIVKLYPCGVFFRATSGCGGRWKTDGEGGLFLDWFDWAEEYFDFVFPAVDINSESTT